MMATHLQQLLDYQWFAEKVCAGGPLHPVDLLALGSCCRCCLDATESSWQLLCQAQGYSRLSACGWRVSYLSHLRRRIAARTPGAAYQKLERIKNRCPVFKVKSRRASGPRQHVLVMKVCHWQYCCDEGVDSRLIRQIAVLRMLRHPNVVRLVEVLHSENRFHAIYEYCDESLARVMERQQSGLDPSLIKSYAFQLIAAVQYCHSRAVMHRDIKPQHIQCNRDGTLKLIDFSLARSFSVPMREYTHEVVTLWYRAPEVLLGLQRYSNAIDLWSVGLVLAEMALGRPLLPGDSEIGQLFKTFQVLGTPTEDSWPGCTALPNFSKTFPICTYRSQTQTLLQIKEASTLSSVFSVFSVLLRSRTHAYTRRANASVGKDHTSMGWHRSPGLRCH